MTQETLETPNQAHNEIDSQLGEQGTGVQPGELVTSLGTTAYSYFPDVDLGAYKGKEGSYNVNNGIACAVLSEGEVVSAPVCGVIERFIAEEGLSRNEALGVIGSNSEFYEGRIGEYAKGNGRDHKLGLALAADSIEKTSVLPDYRDGAYVPGDWFAMSRAGYQYIPGQVALKRGETPQQKDLKAENQISLAHDGKETEIRLREVGHYGINNGVLAFVDGRGDVFAAPATPERETALVTAGYTPDSVGVPMSNGERLVNEDIRSQWDAAMEQAAQERSGV